MRKSVYRFKTIAGLLCFFLTYCNKTGNVAQGNDANAGKLAPNALLKASATITAADGGYINVGSAQLAIPQGALSSDTQITAELIDLPEQVAGGQKLGKAIKLTPEGLQFLIPADLTICYEGSAVNGLIENTTTVFYKTDSNQLIGIAGSVNPVTHCVKSHIEHFSSYVAVAQSQVAGNTAPAIGGANFLPTTPLAGIPLRVRTQINDLNGGAATGQVVSAFFIWCHTGDTACDLNPATATNKVSLQPDTTDDTVTNRYFYLLPASAVTLAGIDYRFQATDNLNVTTTTAIFTRTVPSAANGLQFSIVSPLNIASGFTRAITLQASDNAPTGPWQNISIENQNLSNTAVGSIVRSGPSTIRLSTTGAGAAAITSTVGAFTASLNVNVIAGLLTHIEITDLNQVHLTGTYLIGTNQTADFDAVGYDAYGNMSVIKPVFSTTGGIGTMLIDATGAHFTAGASATTGTLTATIAGLNDTLNFLVYVPPAVAATAPVDGAANVNYTGSNIAVTFTKSMDAATLTTNTTTACSGSIQVSNTSFADCVPMTQATPVFFSGNSLAIVTPAGPLAGNTTYKVRVLAAARDTFAYPMAATYTSITGFLTIPDVTPPASGATITFSAVGNRHLTVNWPAGTDDSSPTGALQYKLVKDNSSTANINSVALANAKSGSDLLQDWTSGITTKIVNGLTGTTTYHFAVLVRDVSGNISLYAPATQATTTWELTGPMALGRSHLSATLLADGRVLVTGGYSDFGYPLIAEIFDPTTGTFAATGSLATSRHVHTATLLADGRVLITGGYNNAYLTSSEIFDPATGTFSTTGSLTTGRYIHTATLLADGRVLITGGYNNGSILSSVEIYNPVTGSFSPAGFMTWPRYGHTATLLNDGQVLIVGGYMGTFMSAAEIYNPVSGTSFAVGSMVSTRAYHTATKLADGRVVLIGGYNGSTVATAEIYDPMLGGFSGTGSMATGRYYHTATMLTDGRVLLAAGYSSVTGTHASAEIFNPLLGTFSPGGTLSNARHQHAAARLVDGRVLIIGGSTGSTNLPSAELFE